ncbi:MAG: tRNA pseudouridine(38-40) synthase TruA [Ruminococcaceae bacterium]|nr:tRNA pseudouridine(38-40) synthase TruA [Oscillospiraceae bacterium]
MKILLHISFLGTAYAGYQIQKDQNTVQKVLCDGAERVFGFPCDITGCSRTDSGVHAKHFCATVTEKGKNTLHTSIPTERIPLAFGSVLPSDVSVFDAEEVSEDFHPRYDVLEKEYEYRIYNRRTRDPFSADRSWHYPKRIDDEALSKMRRAAKQLVGRHDFAAYMASGSSVEDTVREVKAAEVTREGDFIVFRVSADGFLYNMVRIFTGTLIGVAEGKISPEEISSITESKDRSRAGVTAPAAGLYLNKVTYKK